MREAGPGRTFCDGSRAERVVSGVSTNVTPSSAARVKSGNDIGSWSDDQQDTLHTRGTGCRRSRGDFGSYSLKPVTGARQGCRQEVASNISVAIKTRHSCSFSSRTAHTLNSGILLVGSSAAFVRLLADCSPLQ